MACPVSSISDDALMVTGEFDGLGSVDDVADPRPRTRSTRAASHMDKSQLRVSL